MKSIEIFILLIIALLDSDLLVSAKPFDSQSPEEFYFNELKDIKVRKRNSDPEDDIFQEIEYDVHLETADETKKLNLKLAEDPLFTPDFKAGLIGLDDSGHYVLTDTTPRREELEYIEENTYLDHESDAAVHVWDKAGYFHLDGFVNGARVKRSGDNHVISDPGLTRAQSRSMARADKDVVDLQRPVARRRGFTASGVQATIDLAFVVGYQYSVKFKFNTQALLNYLTIMVNSVNTRFSLVQDPKFTFKLAGTFFTNSTTAQPYIEKAKNGTGYNVGKILPMFGEWAAQNMKILPPHDLLVLLTKMKSDSDVSGIAYLRGACWMEREGQQKSTSSQAVSITLDDGETYSGSYTLAHELAHSLGAPHDGNAESKDCSWVHGHLMSYEGWGTPNKFHFSNCSKREMKSFLESTGAFCLYKDVTTKYIPLPANKDVGDVLHPSQQCKFEAKANLSYATDDSTADEYCRRVICKVPKPGTLNARIFSKNKPPGYHTPCGRGGKCEHGTCKNNKETPSERLDMHISCVRRSGNPNAELVIADTADGQCEQLKCSVDMKGKTMIIGYGAPMNGSFPCGHDGVCYNKKCVGNKEDPDARLDLRKVCAVKTGKPQAKVYEGTLQAEYCKILKCEYHEGGSTKIMSYGDYVFPNDSHHCGFNGKCVNKECVGESADRFDMNKVCQKKIGNEKAKVNSQVAPDEQCKKLACEYPHEEDPNSIYTRSYKIVPEDGSFPCGANNGTCKNQACVANK